MTAQGTFTLSGRVALVAGRAEHSVGSVVEELRGFGAVVVTVDPPASPDEARHVVANCLSAHGRLDALLCAAVPLAGPALLGSDDAELIAGWRDVVAPALFLTQAALEPLVAAGAGRVVFVADPSGLLYAHGDDHTAYDLAMGAVTAMLRSCAQEGTDGGVRTNAVLAITGSGQAPLADPGVVSTAVWLAGAQCDVSGRFFAAGAGRIREVFVNVGHGYQSPVPPELSVEEVAANWAAALSFDGGATPADQVEYHGFRREVYRAHVRQ